ncbi:MAG: hypothetical protein AB1505_28000 [Candidatus Latescibacterota bacterium]
MEPLDSEDPAPGGARSARPAPGQTGPWTGLWAGVARADVTDYGAGPANDPLCVKALVLRDSSTAAAIVTVDAVAVAEIGSVPAGFLDEVRAALCDDPGLAATQLVIGASHCHGTVCADVARHTVQAVRTAWGAAVPVRAGAGAGHEDRIQENRRLKLKSGREADVRRAYSLAADEEVEAVGPIDPQIGILRLDRLDGSTLAVVYNFACHPIQGVPGGGNTADLVGFASAVVEASCGPGALALFLQGCGGDINPVLYKDVDHPRDAEPLGNLLGLSVVRAVKQIRCRDAAPLRLASSTLGLPRADLAPPIAALETAQDQLLASLTGTTLDLKTFLQLAARYNLAGAYPSGHAHRYLHDRSLGRRDLDRLDEENRRHMAEYAARVRTMEELTRVRTNLDLLRAHQARSTAAGSATVRVEILGLRVGDFVLLTFPGELSVEIGLRLKEASPHALTFVATCTNGYIYYAPTAQQLRNRGWAQEDSDCLLAPQWQEVFEARVHGMLRGL